MDLLAATISDEENALISKKAVKKACSKIEEITKAKGLEKRFAEDVYRIVTGYYIKPELEDFDKGMTLGERKKFISGFQHEVQQIIKRLNKAKELYPDLYDENTDQTHETIPNWLSQFTGAFDLKHLGKTNESLKIFGAQIEGWERRLATSRLPKATRGYFIQETMVLFESYAEEEVKVDKSTPTGFSEFLKVFLGLIPPSMGIKTIGLSSLYDEVIKIKKDQTSFYNHNSNFI